MRLKEDGGRGALWMALAYRPAIGPSILLPNSPDLALPHLSRSDVPFCQQLICSPTLLYLSPFTLCFPFTSCSVGLEEIYSWVWSLFTVVYMRLIMDHRALLSATFFFLPPPSMMSVLLTFPLLCICCATVLPLRSVLTFHGPPTHLTWYRCVTDFDGKWFFFFRFCLSERKKKTSIIYATL